MHRPAFFGAALCALVGCVDPAANNAASSNNNTASTTSGSTGQTSDAASDCTAGLFAQTVPYTSGNALPFAFEIPARFGNIDATTRDEVAGSTFDVTSEGTPGEFQMRYSVAISPSSDTTAPAARWERDGDEETSVEFGGAGLAAWRSEGEDLDRLRFFLSIEGADHEVMLEWVSPAGCLVERRVIRDLAMRSLAPNLESTFTD